MSDQLRVYLYSDDRAEAYPVFSFVSLSVSKGKHEWEDSAQLAFRPSDYWVDQTPLDIANPEYGAGLSIDVFWRDFTTPLFSGPVETVELREDRGGPIAVFSLKSWMHRILSARLILDGASVKMDFAAAADSVVLLILQEAGYKQSGTPTAPTGYPGGVSRKDFGPITVDTTAAGTASTINPDVSEGRRVLEEVAQICEDRGMTIETTSWSAAQITINVDPTYQNNDYTDAVVLQLGRASASSYAETVDYSAMENLFLMKGSGSGPGQAKAYSSDSTSITDYGLYEGGSTAVEIDATAAGEEAVLGAARFKDPLITVDAGALDSPTATFNSDYAVRDLVTVRSGAWSRNVEKLVIGASLTASGNGAVSVRVMLGDPPLRYGDALRRFDGTLPGRGRGFGGRHKAVAG